MQEQPLKINEIFLLVEDELALARRKFPGNKQRLYAFCEESGEVTKAFLDLQQGKTTSDEVRAELIQTICVAVRLLQEGDADFPEFIP